MRSISSGFTDIAESDVRIIGAYATVKDHRIRFYNLNKIGNDSALYDGAMHSHDSDANGSTIYRVANISGTLWYQYLSNPGGSWPNWQSSGRTLKSGSRPGIYKNCVWYQKSNNEIKRAYFSGSSLGGEIDVAQSPSQICALAPYTHDECIVRMHSSGEHNAKIAYMKDQSVGIGPLYYWSGRLYKRDISPDAIEDQLFDAEKDPYTGWIHVFWSDESIGRVKTMKFSHIAGRFGPIEGVIPMDVVDDLNNFRLGGVTPMPGSSWRSDIAAPSIAGQLWLGGALVRTDGGHMQAYMEGPPWTFGRDVFVGTDGTEERTYSGKTVPVAGGKMHFVGSKIYYIGPGVAYEASGVDWTGDSSPSMTIEDIDNWKLSQDQNQAARLQLDIPHTTSGTALREGSEITMYATYKQEGGSTYTAKVGVFNIDVMLDARESTGEFKTIIARSKSGKALEMWAPDTSYDYWGADHKIALPATQTELIRQDGNIIESGGYLIANELNDHEYVQGQIWRNGHAYSLARPSRGGICKIRFRFDNDTLYDPQVGITLNMYRENEQEALDRIDDEHIARFGGKLAWWQYGTNLIAIVWGKREHTSDTPGISIRWIGDSEWVPWNAGEILGTYSLNLSAATDYWLMSTFTEGVLSVYYRLDSSTSWTTIATLTLGEVLGNLLPWHREDQKGRFGLYLYNETPYQTIRGVLASDGAYCPFWSLTDQYGRTFPAPDTYIVDHEQIQVSAIVGHNSPIGLNGTIEGHIWPNVSQSYPNPYQGPWTGYQSVWDFSISTDTSKDYYDGMLLYNKSSGAQAIVSDWDYNAPRQWIPNDPDDPNWIDTVGNVSYGEWSGQVCRVFTATELRNIRKDQDWRISAAGAATRGYGDTQQTTHSYLAMLSLYTASRIKVDRFQAFTSEREWSMSDMMTEIARKAGVELIEPKFHLDPDRTRVRSSASWALGSQMSNYGVRTANVVARVKSSGSEYGIQFGRVLSGSSYSGGWACTILGATARLYTADSMTLLESFPIGSTPNGWVTFSVQKNRVNVYETETLIASFKLPSDIDTQAYAAPVYRGATVRYDWPELSMRVDNFIMDIGKKGSQILGQLIGQKRLYWQDDQDGKLRLYRERVTVNSGDPWAMTAEMTNLFNEADLATRVRVEGAEAWQAISEEAVQEHGSVFRVFNAEDAENAQDAAVEAEWLLEETSKRANKYVLTGAADLRVEAGDIYEVSLPDGDVSVVVDSIQYQMRVQPNMAVFDMTIQGHNAEI